MLPTSSSVKSQSLAFSRAGLIGVGGALIFQVLLLSVVGWTNRLQINPDAVAYIRIARYFASWQPDLMISGYWGPLLSWLMVPWLGLTAHPLGAARIAMGLSAVVFLVGCLAIFRSVQLTRAGVVLGAWVVAAASAYWSGLHITPDLLLSGLLGLAISRMLSPQWITNPATPFTAGILCGAAFLAKPVAFPVTFGLGVSLGLLWVMSRAHETPRVLRSLVTTLLGFALIAGPWVVILSLHYHRLTFSTSGPIAHALVGPGKKWGKDLHPFRETFHIPEPGRVTSWEDPSDMPYEYWSPFESLAHAKHQLLLIRRNFARVLSVLQSFDRLGLGLIALVLGFLVHRPWRENLAIERWRWAAVPVACLAGIFLPVWAYDQRYYLPTYPFLFAASVGMVGWLTPNAQGGLSVPRVMGLGLLLASFASPVVQKLPIAVTGIPPHEPGFEYAHVYEVAKRLRAAGIHGPVAGVNHIAGLYVAFHMNQPWYGNERNPTIPRIKASQATLVVLSRDSPLTSELDHDSSFITLDHILFQSEEEALMFPLKVYRIMTP